MSEEPIESLKGSIEYVTFHNEESGFCVLKVKVKTKGDLVPVLGHTPQISAGEQIECEGVWVNDPRYGMQFKASSIAIIHPTTVKGIEKYLSSGMVKGIGPHFAKKLVKAFGDQVFDIIENDPDQLKTLSGIGETRVASVVESWHEQRSVRDIMVFLQSHGLGTARAFRIYKTYGDDAISLVKKNPYRLALDIRGIGFKAADTLALSLGLSDDSLIRAEAGVRHVLQEISKDGHCAATQEELIAKSAALLEVPVFLIESAIQSQRQAGHVVKDTIDGMDCFYPMSLYRAEVQAVEHITRLNRFGCPWSNIACDESIDRAEQETGMPLAESQRHAMMVLLDSKITIITGGPGVGKTTIIDGFIRIMREASMNVVLCAPTGRAAKRMNESTGMEAKTIHRLLEFDPVNSGFLHNEQKPLSGDVFVVDEASMMDISLFHHLLKAIPDHAALVLAGDIDQLPSVGPGSVLSDLIQSGAIRTVQLTEIFRQESGSDIIVNAHRINQGKMPMNPESGEGDFFVLVEDTPEAIKETVIDLVVDRLPRCLNCNPLTDIQVLSPMNKGVLGCISLNESLRQALNPNTQQEVSRFGSTYSTGDRVIQRRNNYEKGVFNGDIGVIDSIDMEEGILSIRFEDEVKKYEGNELDEIGLSYAITIHKSQGSEFPVVVIPLISQHYRLLARNLLYTGITRGKHLVVLVGQEKAIRKAVKNNKQAHRRTNLSTRVKSLCAA